MSAEIWKPIAGYEGLYEVSSHGRVRSIIEDRNRRRRELKAFNSGYGYVVISLTGRLGLKRHFVHRLVAAAFIPNPLGLPAVNHIDACKTNNQVENLEWVTLAENNRHAARMGITPRGSKHHYAKLDEAKVVDMRKRHRMGETLRGLAAAFDTSFTNVFHVVNFQTWKHVKDEVAA